MQNESTIGILRHDQYNLKNTPTADSTFIVISDQATFDATFTASEGEHPRQPDFSGQTVATISVSSRNPVIIEKATIYKEVMNIYASTCKTEMAGCPPNGLALVTTPKSPAVKDVQFYINGIAVRKIKK